MLFSETNSRFIVEVAPDNRKKFEKHFKGISLGILGEINDTDEMEVIGLKGNTVVKSGLNSMKKTWKKPIEEVMHEKC